MVTRSILGGMNFHGLPKSLAGCRASRLPAPSQNTEKEQHLPLLVLSVVHAMDLATQNVLLAAQCEGM